MLDLNVSQIIIQIIAFLLMFWVMKKYGWKPLLGALDARRQKIQAEFDDVQAEKEKAQHLTASYEDKLREISADARKKIQEAIAEGHRISVGIQDEAQKNAKEIVQKARLEIAEELTKAKNQLKDDVVNLVVNTTEKILQENLNDSSQKTLISNFVEEVARNG